MKNILPFIILLILWGCQKSKQIAPNLEIHEISRYPICGFLDVEVYEIKTEVIIDSSFFKFPSTKFLYNLNPRATWKNSKHKIIRWKKIEETDLNIIKQIQITNQECDIYLFSENSDYVNTELYYSGIASLYNDGSFNYYEGFLIMNPQSKKLFVFENYEKGAIW